LNDAVGVVSGIVEAKAMRSGKIEILFGHGLYRDARDGITYRGDLHIVSIDDDTIAVNAPYVSNSGQIINQDFRWTRISK